MKISLHLLSKRFPGSCKCSDERQNSKTVTQIIYIVQLFCRWGGWWLPGTSFSPIFPDVTLLCWLFFTCSPQSPFLTFIFHVGCFLGHIPVELSCQQVSNCVCPVGCTIRRFEEISLAIRTKKKGRRWEFSYSMTVSYPKSHWKKKCQWAFSIHFLLGV